MSSPSLKVSLFLKHIYTYTVMLKGDHDLQCCFPDCYTSHTSQGLIQFSFYICLFFSLVLLVSVWSSMAHWVFLIIFPVFSISPLSVGANYDLQSVAVASLSISYPIWMRNPYVAACSSRLSLPVLPKEKSWPSGLT